MTTAMSVYHSGGEAGRCDANCHEAQEPECDCCCGGRLHGCGSSRRAIEINTADYFGSLEAAEAWAKRNGIQRPAIKAAGMKRRRLLRPVLQREQAERRRRGIVRGQIPLGI